MSTHTILWADDEIDLLKPHIMFLKNKGYNLVTVNNGHDALELVESQHFDLIILDNLLANLHSITIAKCTISKQEACDTLTSL